MSDENKNEWEEIAAVDFVMKTIHARHGEGKYRLLRQKEKAPPKLLRGYSVQYKKDLNDYFIYDIRTTNGGVIMLSLRSMTTKGGFVIQHDWGDVEFVRNREGEIIYHAEP